MVELTHIAASFIDTSHLPKPNTANTLQNALDVVFALGASVALLVIVISGFRYIAAHGDPNSTATARNGILYAVIGLLVILAAYSIVLFVVKGVG